MTTCQFWIQTSVQIFGVLATFALAGIAIWGDVLRARWLGPRLSISLSSASGELTNYQNGELVHHYHLKVCNQRRHVIAKNVRVVLVKTELYAANESKPLSIWSGQVQLEWQHGLFKDQFLTVGPEQIVDLGRISENGVFELSTLIKPNNFLGSLKANEKMHLQAVVLSDEVESNPICIEIRWDGIWEKEAAKMAEHFEIKEVACH